MSWKHVKAVMKFDLPHSEKCLLLVVAQMANKDHSCFPSLDYLAAHAGFADRRSVRRVMDRLVGKGLVEKLPCPNPRLRNSNLYKVIHDNATARIIDMVQEGDTESRGGKSPWGTGSPEYLKGTISNVLNVGASNVVTIEDSERIYQAYPRKVQKAAALKKIQQVAEERGVEFLEDRVKTFAEGWKQRIEIEGPKVGKFIPYMTSWLNQGRFDDDEAEWFPVKKRKIDYSAGF